MVAGGGTEFMAFAEIEKLICLPLALLFPLEMEKRAGSGDRLSNSYFTG